MNPSTKKNFSIALILAAALASPAFAGTDAPSEFPAGCQPIDLYAEAHKVNSWAACYQIASILNYGKYTWGIDCSNRDNAVKKLNDEWHINSSKKLLSTTRLRMCSMPVGNSNSPVFEIYAQALDGGTQGVGRKIRTMKLPYLYNKTKKQYEENALIFSAIPESGSNFKRASRQGIYPIADDSNPPAFGYLNTSNLITPTSLDANAYVYDRKENDRLDGYYRAYVMGNSPGHLLAKAVGFGYEKVIGLYRSDWDKPFNSTQEDRLSAWQRNPVFSREKINSDHVSTTSTAILKADAQTASLTAAATAQPAALQTTAVQLNAPAAKKTTNRNSFPEGCKLIDLKNEVKKVDPVLSCVQLVDQSLSRKSADRKAFNNLANVGDFCRKGSGTNWVLSVQSFEESTKKLVSNTGLQLCYKSVPAPKDYSPGDYVEIYAKSMGSKVKVLPYTYVQTSGQKENEPIKFTEIGRPAVNESQYLTIADPIKALRSLSASDMITPNMMSPQFRPVDSVRSLSVVDLYPKGIIPGVYLANATLPKTRANRYPRSVAINFSVEQKKKEQDRQERIAQEKDKPSKKEMHENEYYRELAQGVLDDLQGKSPSGKKRSFRPSVKDSAPPMDNTAVSAGSPSGHED